MNLGKRIALTIISVIGFITSIKLSMIYMDVNFNPYALSSFCSINELIDCDGVAKTVHSQFFGIPLAFWGLFLYFIFLFFTFVDKIQKIKFLGFLGEVFTRPEAYICALGFLSFAISMSLACISIFEIQKICVLCFFTYILNLVIAIVARPKGENPWSVFVISFKDFISAIKVKKYAISFSILVLIAIGILSYTTISNVLTPQVKMQKELNYYSTPNGEYKVSGNTLGEENAAVVIYEYTDYQCPFCFVLNTMLQRAVSELSNIKVIHVNLPLDNECNTYMNSQMHPGSCMMAKYALAAKYQGKFWDMNNMLFDNDFTTEEEIIEKASKSIKGLNIEKLKEDAHSMKINEELKNDIKTATEYGIDGTPALRINMETKVGILPYPELKEKLIKAGAKERK